jgi:hypothetical protein
VPSRVMRSASQAGTWPPCRGVSANPERFTLHYPIGIVSLPFV